MVSPESINTIPIGNALTIWTTLFLIWSSGFFVVRIWAKAKQQWSLGDGVFVTVYVSILAQCSTVYLTVVHYHLGNEAKDRMVSDYEKWMEALYASQVLYVLSMGLSKCSTTLFLDSLSRSQKHSRASFALKATIIVWTIGSCLIIALRQPLSAPWKDVKSSYIRWLVVEIAGLAIEFAIWAFAFALIWDLNLKVHRRVKLLMIFAARLLLVPIIAVRLDRLRWPAYQHTLYYIVINSILIQLALHWALVSECLTCLKPFLRTWHDGVPADGSTPHYWGALSNLHSEGSKVKSGADKINQRMSAHSKTRHPAEEDGELKLRVDDAGFSTKIASERTGSSATWQMEDDDIELLPASRIKVRTTTTMTSS